MMTNRIDVEDIRAELRVQDVIAHYGLKVRKRGSQYRLSECPRCHQKSSREAIAIDGRTGRWIHHGREREAGGECSGDILDLVAACECLDSRRDFVEVKERAAKLAGVDARDLTSEEREARRVSRERQAAELARRAATEDAAALREAKLRAAAETKRLRRWSPAGAAYLERTRGLDPRWLVDQGHVLFAPNGDICVRLHGFDGDLVNVVRRVIAPLPESPKIVGLPGCPTAGTLVGRIQEIAGDIVVVEGVVDGLTAAQLWPDRVVLGAHGAGRLPSVVEAAAPLVRDAGARMFLVPDADDVGQRCALRAGEAAIRAGLVMDRTLIVLELEHHDLNTAFCAGWRP